ncbi:mannose-1-phosphate guanylyltransferase [Altibacter sp. HG106]|uniref:mannose-1-phosphate guanylyltransferase n=1 Tax=Altibacter sp. HG106 TaxID=3023937 RepID=UPI00235024FA|nr:mannose-1-phosphate guanylyltransferase [Altibacter sp. HG106]MDC7995952.1 mannose-1-phosphate guanylyltransferase [Altibacter sp. HG106]
MNTNYYAVIMAGGIGSRFWPVSTSQFPKQFHDMLGTGQSLLQKTFNRLTQLVPPQNIRVLTNDRYLDLTLTQLPKIDASQVILEPAMRNTAPCILMAAMKIQKENPNALMLVAPSDHWIEDETAFQADVMQCFGRCEQNDHLLTLGIPPAFPNTGYGYIESAAEDIKGIKNVLQFREKPDYDTAKEFVAAGNFYWNAGIFIWSVTSITTAFETHEPVMHALFSEGKPVYNTSEEIEFVRNNYEKAENISIDYAIMEKANNVFVKEANFDWNDLGTWGALHDKLASHSSENATVRATLHAESAKGNMVYTAKEKLVVIDGLKDYIIVDKEGVLMIYPKSKEQDIKKLVADIRQQYGDQYL